MVLAELPELDADWARAPSQTRVYPPDVERWRGDVAKLMPLSLRARPDATLLVDKLLHVANYESGGNPNVKPGDGGIAKGLFQSHYLPDGSTPEQQINDAWRLVLENPDQYTHWGEGVTYQGKVFGALGNHPYQNGPPTATRISPPSIEGSNTYATGTVGGSESAKLIVQKRLDAQASREALSSEQSRAAVEAQLGQLLPALPHEEEARFSHGPDPYGSPPATDLGGGLSLPPPPSSPDLNTGDVPVGSGQGEPGLQARMQRIADLTGSGALGGLKDFATSDVPGAGYLKSAVKTAGDIGLAPTGPLALLTPASVVSRALGGPDIPTAGDVLASQTPTTPLDIALTAPPGDAARVARGGLRVLEGGREAQQGVRGAENVLSIVGKAKPTPQELYALLRSQGHSDEEIAGAFGQFAVDAGKGGIDVARQIATSRETERAASAAAAKRTYGNTLDATGDLEQAARDAKVAAAKARDEIASKQKPNVLATDETRSAMQQASENARMPGNAIVEPKKTGWTVTNAAGNARQVETELPHGYQDTGSPEAALERLRSNQADQRALNDAIRGDKAAASAQRSREAIDALSAEADALDAAAAARGGTPGPDALTQAVSVAKKLGNPTDLIRGGADNVLGIDRKRPKPGEDPIFDSTYRTPIKRTADEIAIRRGPYMDASMHDLAQGLELNPDAIGLQSQDYLTRQGETFRAGSVSKNRSELGRNTAQLEVWKMIDKGYNPAEIVDAMSEAYQYRKGTTPLDRGFIAEMQRLQEKLTDFSDGNLALKWDAVQTQADALKQRGSQAFDQDFRAAAAAERKLGPGLAEQAARADKWAERKAVEQHQARVEAADLERRKQAWVEKTKQEAAMSEARGYQSGGIGNEIVGALGLPRTLSLSGDVGTARDLGLFVGTKEGRQALARGGSAGLRSVVHSDADARLVIDEANKGSRWFEWASDAKNLPGEREYHPYDFGAGASSVSRVPEMSGLNESAISRAVEKYNPAIKFSDRALAVQRNVAGVDLLESRLNEIALKYGVSGPEDAASNARFLSEAQSTIDSVNHLRGYSGGSKAQALGALNALTSPQQLISRLQVLGDPLNFALRGDMESAKFAAQSLAGFATSQGALLALAHLTGGPGRWSVNLNPVAGDFGTVRVGNSRYDTMAGLGPTMRLVAKVGGEVSDQAFDTDYAKNQAAIGVLVQRWLENKEQPVSRVVTDFMLHNKLPNEQTAINMLAPSIATGFMQSLAEERGNNKLLAVPNAALNFGGVGVNTYSNADDYKNQVAGDIYNGRAYDSLNPVERLKVLANLPEDAGKNAMTTDRQDYQQAASKAGYLEAPKDGDGKPLKETDSERQKRLTRNADVIRSNPDLDVQRWFYGSKDGGSLSTQEAVTKALSLDLQGRKVNYAGSDRNLSDSADDKKAWKEWGDRIEWYEHGLTSDPKNLQSATNAKYPGKQYGNLKATEQDNVKSALKEAAAKDPQTEALLIFFGVEKPNKDKLYSASSPQTLEALKELWKDYPHAEPLPKPDTQVGVATRR